MFRCTTEAKMYRYMVEGTGNPHVEDLNSHRMQANRRLPGIPVWDITVAVLHWYNSLTACKQTTGYRYMAQ